MMRLNFRNSLYFIAAGAIGAVLLIYDWIRITISLNDPVLNGIRDIFSIFAFIFLYAAINAVRSKKQSRPLETLRKLVGYAFFAAAIILMWEFFSNRRGAVVDRSCRKISCSFSRPLSLRLLSLRSSFS